MTVTNRSSDPESRTKREPREGLTVGICFSHLMKKKRTNGC